VNLWEMFAKDPGGIPATETLCRESQNSARPKSHGTHDRLPWSKWSWRDWLSDVDLRMCGQRGAGKPHARICEGEAEWLSYSTTTRSRIGDHRAGRRLCSPRSRYFKYVTSAI
jgi:hypothetical protein